MTLFGRNMMGFGSAVKIIKANAYLWFGVVQRRKIIIFATLIYIDR